MNFILGDFRKKDVSQIKVRGCPRINPADKPVSTLSEELFQWSSLFHKQVSLAALKLI